jgi:tRNA (mo5U34)-methyltransferase
MKLPILDAIGLPAGMSGLRALDIGCSDGFFSFEMERRGASVVAIDFVPEDYTGFAIAKKILGSSVEYRMDNAYNLSPGAYGKFDVVLFMGVLYHLRNPMAGMDAIRSVMNEGANLFVGTMMIDEYFLLPDGTVTTLASVNPMLLDVPLWQAYPSDTLNGDYTNCFAPNKKALIAALQEAQFTVDEMTTVSMGGYARASAISDARKAKYQELDGRLHKTAFDPAIPYFLDEEGSVHAVTGSKSANAATAVSTSKRWWEFWRRWI